MPLVPGIALPLLAATAASLSDSVQEPARFRSHGAAVKAAGSGCETDTDCGSATWRCCGASIRAENCPQPSGGGGSTGACVLPGTIGATQCRCTAVPPSMCGAVPAATTPKNRQWLMIGDSISEGSLPDARTLAAAKGIEVTHNPTNAANVVWGAHCLDAWLGAESAARWDVISWNFGLHDLALDNERVEPAAYAELLGNMTKRIAAAAPRAKLLWVTTTPVPLGIDGACNKSTGQGGCPPRRASDPAVYNAAAAAAVGTAGATLATLDLNALVASKCGANYTLCPEGCTATRAKGGGWEGTCLQIPGNVHYLPAGWTMLATAYVNAVAKLLLE